MSQAWVTMTTALWNIESENYYKRFGSEYRSRVKHSRMNITLNGSREYHVESPVIFLFIQSFYGPDKRYRDILRRKKAN